MSKTNYFLDTNILVRYLTQDGIKAYIVAKNHIEKIVRKEIFGVVSTLVLHEAVHILEKVYKLDSNLVCSSITRLLSLKNLSVIDLDKSRVVRALENHRKHNIDFPDCIYHQFTQVYRLNMLTFDKHFKKFNIEPLTA